MLQILPEQQVNLFLQERITVVSIDFDYKILGKIGTNCYLLYNKDNREAVLIDPADEAKVIKEMIASKNCTLKAILLTHGHYDHIGAAAEISKATKAPIYAGEYEKEVLANPDINLSAMMAEHPIRLIADKWLADGEVIEIGGMAIRCIHTPGHTEGGMSYYVEDANILFSGDTLFAASVGRTDFPTGSMSELVRSIKSKLLILPENTKVFTGHGESTSIIYEKQYNPFLS